MHTKLLALFFVGLQVCFSQPSVAASDELERRREEILKRSDANSTEALARKARSEEILNSGGVPINPYLPVIETAEEAKRRTVEEISRRAMALLTVAIKAEAPEDRKLIDDLVARYQLKDAFSPVELAFIQDPAPKFHDRVQFSWRYEAAWVLLWALGYVEGDLDRPESTCDVPLAVSFLADRTREQFIAEASLRPLEEILDQADLIYRYHWAARDAQLNDQEVPAGLNIDTIQERHYTLNWLIGYMDREWDDVTTDT